MLTFLFTKNCLAQLVKVEGTVKDKSAQILPSATLQLKDAASLNVVTFGFTNANGNYSLTADLKGNVKYYLIASYLGYKRDTLLITNATIINQVITHHFVLQTDENQLKEINIEAPKRAIEVDNDTTKYNVSKFTSPEDRNLEAVIRKMPGMEVSKDGTIYFKQKKISGVLLENDDLTGSNYKAITQNINPELVNEVQAIEHWVEDDLLKGIINSDDIVLNLTLKDKRKKKIIGSVDVAYGTDNRNDVSTNLVTFVNKTKAYAFVRNNNVGSSQEDIFKLAGDNRKLIGDGKLINHQISTLNPFDGNAMALNNSLSGSMNAITRFSPAFKVSTSLYGLRNKLFADNTTASIFYSPIEAIIIDQQNMQTNNEQYQADVNTDYLVAKNARFTSKLSYRFRPQQFFGLATSSYNSVLSNQINQIQSDRLNNYNADLKYTLKANTSSAIIIYAKLAKDEVNQNYNPTSNLYQSIPIFNGASNLLQTADTENLWVKFDVQALKRKGKSYFYANVGTDFNQTSLNSNLLNKDTRSIIDGFLNATNFKSYRFYAASKYAFDNRKVLFQSLVKTSLVIQKGFNVDTSFVAFEPDLKLRIKLSNFQNMNLQYNFNYNFANPLDFYEGRILTDIRSINAGLNTALNFGTHNFMLSYNNNDFSEHYFSFNIGANGQFSERGFINNNFFENTIFYNQKLPYNGIKNFATNVGLQKFVPFLSTKFIANYSPSVTNFYGKVGNEVNRYNSLTQLLNTSASTGFKLPINFSFEFQYQQSATNLANEKINDQSNYKYAFQSRYQISKTLFNLVDLNFYKLNGQNYRLLNTELQLSPSKGRFKYAIYGKNLFNVRSINNAFVSNISETNSSTSILGRYFLGSISMSIK